MKKATFTLIIMSIFLMLLYGCSGGSSGGSNSSDAVAAANNAPVAVAGEDQSVAVGESALLSGSGSYDKDEDYPLTYEWQIVSTPEGSAATLSEIVSAGGFDSSQISIKADTIPEKLMSKVLIAREKNGRIYSHSGKYPAPFLG